METDCCVFYRRLRLTTMPTFREPVRKFLSIATEERNLACTTSVDSPWAVLFRDKAALNASMFAA
jgi:hypothetical protein